MNKLSDVLELIPSDRIALITENGKYSYNAIRTLIKNNESIIDSLKDFVVAIKNRRREEFAKLLYLLDGRVRGIVFLPDDIDEGLIERYYLEAEVTYDVWLDNGVLCFSEVGHHCSRHYDLTSWMIPTSGTTNIPKLVSHTFRSLTKTTKHNIEVGKQFIWGLVYDVYRFSGLQVFLQAMIAGSTIIITENGISLSEQLNFLVVHGCNALSATPSFWRKVMMSGESDLLQLKVATLGGEIADDNILKSLKAKYQNAKVLHIYASTEAGVGFSVSDCHAGFPLRYISDGIGSVQLKISDHGTLMIKNSENSQKYVSEKSMYSSDGYINTGDLVCIKDDRVMFLGRDSGAINVGGNKVQPEEVEQVLLSLDYVQAAYVYPKKSPIVGSLVCADIVIKHQQGDPHETKNAIIVYCRARLESFKIPAIIKFVDEIYITNSGKLKRN